MPSERDSITPGAFELTKRVNNYRTGNTQLIGNFTGYQKTFITAELFKDMLDRF